MSDQVNKLIRTAGYIYVAYLIWQWMTWKRFGYCCAIFAGLTAFTYVVEGIDYLNSPHTEVEWRAYWIKTNGENCRKFAEHETSLPVAAQYCECWAGEFVNLVPAYQLDYTYRLYRTFGEGHVFAKRASEICRPISPILTDRAQFHGFDF